MPLTPLGFSYPSGLSDENNPPRFIQELAESIDEYLTSQLSSRVVTGRETVGSLATGTASSITVTFPGDGFATAPRIVAQAETNNPHFFDVGIDLVTTTNFRLTVVRRAGSNTGLNVHWHAKI